MVVRGLVDRFATRVLGGIATVLVCFALCASPSAAQSGIPYTDTIDNVYAYSTFSSQEAADILEAHALAVERVEDAIELLRNNRGAIANNLNAHYTQWFGQFNPTAFFHVLHTFEYCLYALEASVEWAQPDVSLITFGTTLLEWPDDWYGAYEDEFWYFDARLIDSSVGLGAWVYYARDYFDPDKEYSQRNQVWIGWGFWYLTEGPDQWATKAGILVHEATHMFGTVDSGYGRNYAAHLAQTSALAASYNADNYRYFIEYLYGKPTWIDN